MRTSCMLSMYSFITCWSFTNQKNHLLSHAMLCDPVPCTSTEGADTRRVRIHSFIYFFVSIFDLNTRSYASPEEQSRKDEDSYQTL